MLSAAPTKLKEPGKHVGTRGIVAAALLESGTSIRSAAKQTGISQGTAAAIAQRVRKKDYPKHLRADQVEAVKKSIRDRFLLKASDALNGINTSKLQDASALELAKISSICLENAGLGPTPIAEHHTNYFFQQINGALPPVDITPSTLKQEPLVVQTGTAPSDQNTSISASSSVPEQLS